MCLDRKQDALILLMCLHRRRLDATQHEDHPHFESGQSPIHNSCGYMHKRRKKDLKPKNA